MKRLIFETLFLHLFTCLECFCPLTLFSSKELDSLPCFFLSYLYTEFRILSGSVPGLATDSLHLVVFGHKLYNRMPEDTLPLVKTLSHFKGCMCLLTHSRNPHPAIKLWCQVPFIKSKTIFQIEMYCMQCFLKSNISKVELSMIKIGELLRKLWSVRSCFLILPPGALSPQGIEGAMKCDVSKHWCTLQWCASRGWVIAHEDWTSSAVDESLASCMVAHFTVPIFITRDSEEIMFSPCVFVCVWLSVYVCHDVSRTI